LILSKTSDDSLLASRTIFPISYNVTHSPHTIYISFLTIMWQTHLTHVYFPYHTMWQHTHPPRHIVHSTTLTKALCGCRLASRQSAWPSAVLPIPLGPHKSTAPFFRPGVPPCSARDSARWQRQVSMCDITTLTTDWRRLNEYIQYLNVCSTCQ